MMKKRMLSILLCFVMLLGLLPGAVFAADNDTSPNETKKNITFRIEWGEHAGVEIPDYMNVAIFKGTRADLDNKDFNVTNQIVNWALVTAEDNWTQSIAVDKFDADGNEINYSVIVTKIGDYEVKHHISSSDNATVSAPDSWITIANWISSVSGDETNGFTINTYYKEFLFEVKYQFIGDTPEGVAASADSNQYKWGDSYAVASVPKVDGWTFDGWYPYYNSVVLYGNKVDRGAAKQIDTSLNNWNATYYGKWTKERELTRAAMTVTESMEVQRRELNEETGELEWNAVNDQPLMARDKITYTIHVTNETDAFIKGVTIIDTFSGTGKLTLDSNDFVFEDNGDGTYTLKLKGSWGVAKGDTLSVKLNYVVQEGDTVPETTGAAAKMLTNTVTVTYDGKDDTSTLETPINTETFDLLVEKKWFSSGTRAPVTVQLQKNGTPAEQDGELTILPQDHSDTAYGVFRDLPLYDEDGSKIIYSIKETAIDGAALIEEGATVDFGDGNVTCDVFETNDRTGKWYAAYGDTIAADAHIRITNRYIKNAIVVTKEITKIVRSGEELTDKTTARAGDTICYTIRIENTTKSQQTIQFLDQMDTNNSGLIFTGNYDFTIDDLGAGSYKAKNIAIGAGEAITLTAEYVVRVGDGRQTGSGYSVTNTITVNCNGALYEDEVSAKIQKDPDACKIYVPIIKTLNNDGKDDFDGERFEFNLCAEGQDDPKYNWNAYISVDKVHAGGFADEDNAESGEPNTVIELAEADFASLPIDEKTSCPYILISEVKGSNSRVTYDPKTYKLYLVPEKDGGSPMALLGLLSETYDPAETHIYYAIADLDAWNKDGSEVYDCAVKFVNYYDKQEDAALYTITFDANGGTLTGKTTAQTGSDGRLASLPTPTRDGRYAFDGWYTKKTGGTKVTTETVFRADTIVYAHWTYTGGFGGGSCYILTYESNGGTPYRSTTHAYGTVVKLDKTPTRTGYTFTGWYADKGLTEKITEIKMTGNKTVYAGWKSSTDLNSKDHIAYIMGYTDGLVHPTDSITRGQVATVLFRLLNADRQDAIFTTSNYFNDVSIGKWYNNMVSSMANGGYIYGYPDGSFGGDDSITRAEFVVMLVRFIGVDNGATASFSDVSRGYWAYQYIATASSAGWIQGFSDGTFRPSQSITRAEAMTILNRVLNRGVDADSTLPDGYVRFEDNSPSAWYYYDVIEATNDHEYTGSRPSEDWSSLKLGYVYDIAKYEHS